MTLSLHKMLLVPWSLRIVSQGSVMSHFQTLQTVQSEYNLTAIKLAKMVHRNYFKLIENDICWKMCEGNRKSVDYSNIF